MTNVNLDYEKVQYDMVNANSINAESYFNCPIYLTDRPDFLKIVSEVSEERLSKVKKEQKIDDLYPSYMTDSYFDDERLKDFSSYIGQTAWSILDQQGYDMSNFNLAFSEMWTQEHYKHSSMEQHVHGNGAQMVGFYFLETPENCSKVVFHDPRPGKIQVNLPEKDTMSASEASTMINFTPRPGLLIFSNAWLPHSFSRHASDKPIKFVHFNLYAFRVDDEAEVI